MPGTLMSLSVFLMLTGIGATAYHFWLQTSPAPDTLETALRFLAWAAKGILLPLLAWFLLNTGWIRGMPPFIPGESLLIPGTAAWVAELPARLAATTILAASVWGAFTLCWLLADSLIALRSHQDLRPLALFWGLVSLVPAGLTVFAFGAPALGLALGFIAGLVLQGLSPLRRIVEPQPLYSRAESHLKFGRTNEAEQAILSELEKKADDYDGWMMLADLYATKYHDLELADQTVRELCRQPNVHPAQASLALHRLADWHLDLGENPAAAREALEFLSSSFPGTHFAHMARQRLQQLPHSPEALREQRRRRPLRLPTLKDPLDDAEPPGSSPPHPGLQQRIDVCLQALQSDPNAIVPREDLAHILAEDLGNLDQGIEQVELLLSFTDAPSDKVPGWLATAAAWHLRRDRDSARARALLQRLVQDHPTAPQAFAAQRRLSLLEMDDRLRQASPPATPASRPRTPSRAAI